MRAFRYPCPVCRTETNIHQPDCQFNETPRAVIERAYIDILSALTETTLTRDALRQEVDDWQDGIHDRCLKQLENDYRVVEDGGVLELLSEEQRKDEIAQPSYDPLRTIYQKGSVKGAHDNSVFAMIAFYEMVGLSWEETHDRTVAWLRESGAWDRGGFEEDSPEELVQSKRHVYEQGYGWKDKATAAKRVISRKL